MSKSMGNVIDPLQLRKKYGTDAVRWYLLRDMRTGLDATFTHKRFATRYEELANVLGNLVSRTTSMIAKYRSGQLPGKIETELGEEIDKTLNDFQKYMDELQVHSALEIAMDLARQANVYIDKQEPWTLAKDPEQADYLDTVLATLVKILTVLTTLFSPVMPEKMNTLAKRIGLSKLPTFEDLDLVFSTRSSVEIGKPLFPKDNL